MNFLLVSLRKYMMRSKGCQKHVNLIVLLKYLWLEKKTIFWVSLFCTLVGFLSSLLFSYTPKYKSYIYLKEPNFLELDSLPVVFSVLNDVELLKLSNGRENNNVLEAEGSNRKDSDIKSFIFSLYVKNAYSEDFQKLFLEKDWVYDFFSSQGKGNDISWQLFNQSLHIDDSNGGLRITFITNNENVSVQLSKEYASSLMAYTHQKIRNHIGENLEELSMRVDDKYQRMQQEYKVSLAIELVKLKEALWLAESIGVKEPLRNGAVINMDEVSITEGIRRLYQQGSIAIKAEIAAINSRISEPAFIPGIQKVLIAQKKLSELSNAEVDYAKVKPAIIIEESVKANVQTSQWRIVLMGLVLGVFLGSLLALSRFNPEIVDT